MTLSTSGSYLDRADAARVLALFVGPAEVDARMIELACDYEDTSVTEAAVVALLRREDAAGLVLLARAYAAEQDDHTQAHMVDAIETYLSWRNPDDVAQMLRGAVQEESAGTQAGVEELFKNVCSFDTPGAQPPIGPIGRRSIWRRQRRRLGDPS